MALLGFELLRPSATTWGLAAFVLFAAGLLGLRARRRARERLVAPIQLQRFLPGFSLARARSRVLLAALGAGLLALALSGPVRGYTVREVRRRGLDLVVCIDTSHSMLVRDLRPDRLTRAKREVRGLLDRLGDDRVALLTFAGDVLEIAPLTRDTRTLSTLLETISPEDNRVGGTDLGQAIERALRLFDERSGNHEAIVVLTDGEDHEGRALALARRAAERNIRIYVIGMGTPDGGKIPRGRAGGGEEFLTDREGKEVISALAGDTLARVAEESHGAYLAATQSAFPLEEIYQERIARLEGREYSAGEERVPHDRFQWALVAAAVCMLIESGLRETRPAKQRVRSQDKFHPVRPPNRVEFVLTPYPLLGLALWLTLQGVEPIAEQPSTPAVAAWRSSAVEGLREIRRLATEERYDDARSLARGILVPHGIARVRAELDDGGIGGVLLKPIDPVLERLGWNGPPEETRAEVRYADGVVAALAGEGEAALASFERAASLAGPGTLRLEALYDRGAVLLAGAEGLRAQIPELQDPSAALAPTAPPPGPPGSRAPAGAGDEEPPDFLQLARQAYRAARAAFVERLRADWSDADTRANLELIQRRLRELDELEKQREEQEQEQQDPEKQQQEEGEKGEEGEEGEESEQQEEPQDSDESSEPSDEQPESQDESQSEEEPQDAPEEEGEPEESEEEQADSQEESEEQAEEQDTAVEEAQPADEAERVLTREEVVRLLDRLREIDEQAEALRARLRQRGRVAVEKDW